MRSMRSPPTPRTTSTWTACFRWATIRCAREGARSRAGGGGAAPGPRRAHGASGHLGHQRNRGGRRGAERHGDGDGHGADAVHSTARLHQELRKGKNRMRFDCVMALAYVALMGVLVIGNVSGCASKRVPPPV